MSLSISGQPQPLIVVIDDNFDNRLIMKTYVKDLGLDCQTMTGGWQLFTNQLTRPAALILLDLQLPLEDGFAVATQIRHTRAFEGTKLVAVTANHEARFAQEALRTGFNSYLLKPLDRLRFQQHLRRILAGGVVWEGSFGARSMVRSAQ